MMDREIYTMMKNILVIGAHFDDAELGCGATMAKLASEGCRVYKLTLTDNVTNFKQRNISVNFESSLSCSAEACRIIGCEEITDFPFTPCNELTYTTEKMQEIEKIIFDLHIDTVFAHFYSDLNQDHVAASKLSLTAARHCENILYYKSNGYILSEPFYPTVFFDVSDYYEKKAQALAKYVGDHNRLDRLFDISLTRTDIWGYANEKKYCEGFVPVKILL